MLNKVDTTADLSPVLASKPVEAKRMREWLDRKIAASKKGLVSEIVSLTPVLAQLLLDRNPLNRPLSKNNKISLEQDIAADRFQFNGESIKVSNNGILCDGQHRCNAVVVTGKPIKTVITFGMSDESRFTIDTGKQKTAGDFLKMKGRSYYKELASAVSFILRYQARHSFSDGGSNGPKLTKTQIVGGADELPGIDDSIAATVPAAAHLFGHAICAACHYIFKRKAGVAAADEFFELLFSGEGLSRGSPILYCRNKLSTTLRGQRAQTRGEMIFRCWNSWRNNESISLIRLTGSLPKVEK